MIKRYFTYLLVFVLLSCAPTNWLKLDILNPTEFTFPDSGKIVILNASYLPSVVHSKSNLMTLLPSNEQLIFDTLITANLFNGFFSVINESPIENLRNADYEEMRTSDTTNFLYPISSRGIVDICEIHDVRFLIALEYYGFNKKDSSYISDECYWESYLEVSHQLVWRIYRNDGELLNQDIDLDTLFWISNNCTDFLNPELTDAVREVFFYAGEKYGKHISPYWSVISRSYYLISRAGADISLDRDQLVILKSGKKRNLAFKACYNLAVLSESEDKLNEAHNWLEEANDIKQSEIVYNYHKKLHTRLNSREKLDQQTGNN